MTFTWGISGGTLLGGQGGAAITFRADNLGPLTLSCVATNSANVTSSVAYATMEVQAPPPATPQTPVITVSATAVQGQSYEATTPSQAGMTFTWGISGGTLLGGQGGAATTFRADNLGTLTLSCVATNSASVASSVANAVVNVQAPPSSSVPAQGTATTLDIAEWNLEWFGDTSNGPKNEDLQLENIRNVIAGADCDIWSLEEVVSGTSFTNLVSALPGYAGLVASDPAVVNGSSFYTASEQKVALLYKTSLATVQSAQLILTSSDYAFAGRPPMEVKLSVRWNGTSSTLYVICLHAKAADDATSWQRRVDASVALKNYLDTNRAGEKVIVLGDFNDDFDTSITSGKASPYQNFVDDSVGYFVPTKALSDGHIATTMGYTDAIDHQIASHALAATYVGGSVKAFRADNYVLSYKSTTTDHLPVITRWIPAP